MENESPPVIMAMGILDVMGEGTWESSRGCYPPGTDRGKGTQTKDYWLDDTDEVLWGIGCH